MLRLVIAELRLVRNTNCPKEKEEGRCSKTKAQQPVQQFSAARTQGARQETRLENYIYRCV